MKKMLACLCLLTVCAAPALFAQQAAAKKPEKVETLDGRSFFGIVTVKDDYTIVIESDSGLTNLPVAALKGDSWKEYSKDDERKEDGRFWSERKDSLTKGWEKGGKAGPLEAILAPLEPYAASIVSFETQRDAQQKEAADKQPVPSEKAATTTRTEIKLFSGPGALGAGGLPAIPTVPGALPVSPSSLPATPALP